MSDTTTQVNIRLEAEDRAAEVIRSLKRDVDALSRSLRNLTQIRMPAFASGSPLGSPGQAADALRVSAQLLAASKIQATHERQASRQRAADARTEDRQRRALEATALKDLKAREAANARAARQQLAGLRVVEREERRAAAEAERRSNAARSQHARDTRFLFGLRQRHDRDQRREHDRDQRDVRRHGREAWSRARDTYHDTTRPVGMAALAGTAASAAATRRILGAEADADTAEVNAQIFGGLSKDTARQLRDQWAAPLAEELGASTAKMLSGYTEALKVGIPDQGAKAFAGLSIKTSEAWGVGLEKVVDTLGISNTILTSGGKAFDFDRLQSVANAISHLSAKLATTPEKMLSFMERGAGAAQLLGMSQEAGLAFGAASTSLGNQAGESGRLFDYVASRLVEMPRLVKKDGDDGDQARALLRSLGYGNATQLEQQRRANPDEFLFDFIERFGKIKNDRKREQAIRWFTGREWLGEFSRIVTGPDTLKDAQRFAKESKQLDAIGAVWALHRTKLAFTFKQFKAGWLGIMGEIGKELSPLARQVGDYFLGWSANLRNGGLQARVKAALEGLVTGLGFKDMPALLKGIFGEPGQGAAGSIQAWRDAARGFGEGLRDVGNTVRSFFQIFTGQDASAETIGRWSARILGFGAALLIASPAITLLSGLASAILGLGSAAATAFAALKVAGIAGGAGVAGTAATAALTAAGGIIAAGFLAAIATKMNILAPPDMSRGWGRGILEFLDPGLARRLLGDEPKLEKQSYGDGGYNGAFDRRLVQPASFVASDLTASLDRLGRALGATGARAQLATLGASSSTGLGNFVGGGSSGGSGGGVPGFPGGSAPRVPGWFNRGGSGGGGMPDPGTGAGAGHYKGLLDHIARAEGTANRPGGGYNTSLDYGRWTGGEKNLSGMTLDQIDALQTQMLANPENRARYGNGLGSSALGRYQIVRKTLRGLRQRLGLRGDQIFDQAMQDRLGAELVRGRGANGSLGDEWASLRGGKLAEAIELARKIPKGSSTSPAGSLAPNGAAANPGALVGGVHPMDGKGRFTSDFGMRNHPKLGGWRFHKGIDLAAPGGTAVKSMKEGVVSIDRSGDVTVKHPDGTSTSYRHVNAGVKEGDKVAAGQQIASLRQHDPRSTGPHLHLEGRDANGKLIDPKTLLQPKPKTETAEASKDSSPAHKSFTSSGWQPDSWVQTNGGPWTNKRTGEVADAARTVRIEEQAAKARERIRKFMGGPSTGADGGSAFKSSGWKPQNPGADAATATPTAPSDPGFSSSGWKPSSAADAIKKVPMPEPKSAVGGAQGGGPGGGSGMSGPGQRAGFQGAPVSVTIHAGNQSPAELSGHLQRHITEAWNYRAHDLEPELT